MRNNLILLALYVAQSAAVCHTIDRISIHGKDSRKKLSNGWNRPGPASIGSLARNVQAILLWNNAPGHDIDDHMSMSVVSIHKLELAHTIA